MESKRKLALSLFAFVTLASSASAATFYRYKDENGRTVLNNSIPAEFVKYGYEILNERGRVIEVVPRAKTPEEIAAEREKAAAEAKRKKEALEQQKKDELLFHTYPTATDILRARNTQLKAIEVQIGVQRGNLAQIQRHLEANQDVAAQSERENKPVSKFVKESIQSSLEQIARLEEDIQLKKDEQDEISARFARELTRYQVIKANDLAKSEAWAGSVGGYSPVVYKCPVTSNCDAIWNRTPDYLASHSSLAVDITNDQLIMTELPSDETHRAIWIARIERPEEKEQWFVMQLLCTRKGQALCRGDDGLSVYADFKNFASGKNTSN